MRVACVVIEAASPSFDKIYSYAVPEGMRVEPGMRVRVGFGRANKSLTGLILSLEEGGGEALKPILLTLDETPILDEEALRLLRYLKERTFCLWFDALRVLIPAGLCVVGRIAYGKGAPDALPLSDHEQALMDYVYAKKKPVAEESLLETFSLSAGDGSLRSLTERGVLLREEELRRRVSDDKVLMARPVDGWTGPLTPRQRDVMDFLLEAGQASLREIRYYTGATRDVVDALAKKGAAEAFEFTRSRSPYAELAPEEESPALSDEQRRVAEALIARLQEKSPAPALLHGITGSGKTQVFLSVIERVLAEGKTVIVMVPEISLTSQTVWQLQARFGARVAVLHSALSLGERMDEWRRIRDGGADVVAGTRSAVFAPVKNLGLIVIDEEQEHTYKSEKSPRYHARDIALARCRYHGALLLLCSATPSVESYYHAREGRYSLFTLTERFGEAVLPDVYLVDQNDPENRLNSQYLSDTLLLELRYNLEHGEQSILLLNRRGHSTIVKCASCGQGAGCPNCAVSMTYHTANDSLLCHYCGHTQKRPTVCPACGSELMRYDGAGTQKLEQELHALLPDARVLRMDLDTTMAKLSHERMFRSFEDGEYDILLGTQMVAKGLNFPRVTLVGVLSADSALYADDFRGYERTFSLLTQVVGRGGRGEARGRAFIQTFTPEHPVIRLAAMQDYPAFYGQDIQTRKNHLYPPYCVIAGIGFSGENERETREAARDFAARFGAAAKERYPKLPLVMLGPTPAEVARVAGKYRYKLILKCRADSATRELLAGGLEDFYGNYKKVSCFIDMYYDRL